MWKVLFFFFFLMIRRPPRSTQSRSSAASDVYKRQVQDHDLQLQWAVERPRAAPRPTVAVSHDLELVGGPAEADPVPGDLVVPLPGFGRLWQDGDRQEAALRVQGRGKLRDEGREAVAVGRFEPVSYTHLRAHETRHDLVCR